jgi:putative transposase
MATQRRKFTDDQKLEILQEAEKMGVSAVLRAHSLSYSVFAKWKQKFMKPDYSRNNMITGRARSELKLLMEENTRLKKIIADMALELERKDEELRKSHNLYGKR